MDFRGVQSRAHAQKRGDAVDTSGWEHSLSQSLADFGRFSRLPTLRTCCEHELVDTDRDGADVYFLQHLVVAGVLRASNVYHFPL